VPITLGTILYGVFRTERRHSVEMAITVRSNRRRSVCTEYYFCIECFENTWYNVKYAECFGCAKCVGPVSLIKCIPKSVLS
jgi:hypothetical protein